MARTIIKPTTVSSLTGFLKTVSKIKNSLSTDLLVFRGHRDKNFDAIPSTFRNDGWIKSEDKMLRSLLASHPDEFEKDQTTFERLVRAQHYGLPTRLLDVSKNPLVALYFACSGTNTDRLNGEVIVFSPDPSQQMFFDSETVSCLANLALMNSSQTKLMRDTLLSVRDELLEEEVEARKARSPIEDLKELSDRYFHQNLTRLTNLITLVKEEKPNFGLPINPYDLSNVVYVEPRMLHSRLRAQDGAFLLYGLFHETDEYLFQEPIEITEIYVSAKAKPKILNELSSLGISEETLFPEIDRSALQIGRKYRSD